MANIFARPRSTRTASWMCVAMVSMCTGNFVAAQVEADAPGDQEDMAVSSGQNAPPDKATARLSRKYDLNRVGSRGIGGGFDLYSMEKERRLGEKLGSALERTVRQVHDPGSVHYLSELCQKVSRQSDNRFPLTVKIIQSEDANVFAFPGGFLYVTTGVFGAVDNEAELAGLISHEIAHIAARHATKQAARRTLWKVVSTPAMFLPFGGLAIQIGDVAVPMKLSRNAELEADLLGLQYMYLAGYDPSEFLRFLDRAYVPGERKPSRVALMFSEYPSLLDRLGRDQAMISTFPRRDEYVVDTSAFAEVKAVIASHEPQLVRRGQDSSGPRLRRHTH